ncbi:transposase, partial [Flavobacterium columnare]|nr:transposase [Flavobacterium columnare]
MDPITLLKLMLPDFLVDYFEIISVDNSEENLHLYFEEKA